MIEAAGRTYLKLWVLVPLLFLVAPGSGFAQDPGTPREHRDQKFGYHFYYPADWKLETLPEGEANPGLRVRLEGPSGSSFVVIVEPTGQSLSKLEFQADPKSAKRVETMMRQTLDGTYRAISKSLGALDMRIGEKRNLTDDDSIKYYLTTLHKMKTGSPVVVAGTHAYPFLKDYSVNFIMTAFHRGNAAEIRILTLVFNSFRLVDDSKPVPKGQ